MARRPKRTYNQATGQWEVEKLWDSQDDDGKYWKDGVEVDSSGRPIHDAQGNEQGAETPGSATATSTPGSILTTHEPSQAEKDYYAALDAGETPEITQEHLNEIGQGEGGEGHLAGDMVKTPEETAEDNAPENQPAEVDPNFTSEHNSYIDPETGEKKNQTRKEWSASIGDDAISVGPTDTTPNELAGGSLMTEGISGTSGKSGSLSVGGGYGKTRKKEISRGQMNLTAGRTSSLLTS